MTFLRCLLAFGIVTSAGSMACAADVAGDWTLNYPFDQTSWTFQQPTTGPFSAVSEGYIFGDFLANSLMGGNVVGPQLIGATGFVYLGIALPTGVVTARVAGDKMNGTVIDFIWGAYRLSGERSTTSP